MARAVLSRRDLGEAWRAASLRARRLGQPLSLALLDVDDPGRLGDAFGHLAGGAVQHLARLLQARLRPGDGVAGLGDGTLVLLVGSGAPRALQVVQRLQREVASEAYRFENRQVCLTFSAGVAEWMGDDLDAVLARAGAAMERAKAAGGRDVQRG